MIERIDQDGVAVLRLAHGRANALDLELCAAVERALDDAATARAVVLTGTGGIFSAGVDLKRLLAEGPAYLDAFLPALSRMFARVFDHPAPVVAAINGHAVAGGCVLACAADRRVMAEGAGRIGVTELLVGLPFPAFALEVMRFVVPPPRLPEVLYLGRTYEPADAGARGLVDEVIPAAGLLAHAVALAGTLAAVPAATFALTKRHVRQPVARAMAAHGAGIDRAVAVLWSSPGARATVDAYVRRTLGTRARA
jgi:enoyl-CoA hydratase